MVNPSGQAFDWSTVAIALIGVVGVCLGVVLTEVARRRSRAEQFAAVIFERRLEAYQTLLTLVRNAGEIATQVIEGKNLSADERKALVGAAIHLLASHGDENELYLDQDLSPHCSALLIGVEDIADLSEPERQAHIDAFWRKYRGTLRMIREDSGVASVEAVLKGIYKPRITSPFIEYLRQQRKLRNQADEAGS